MCPASRPGKLAPYLSTFCCARIPPGSAAYLPNDSLALIGGKGWEPVSNDLAVCSDPARRPMRAQEPMIATVNKMMPLNGQPNRFSFHIETNK